MLNITYYTFTDIIAAMVMLLGLYKLAGVSRHFVRPMYAAIGFSVFALGELVFGVIDIFSTMDMTTAVACVAMARSLALGVFTIFMLMGMRDICKQLDVERIPLKCRTMIVWTSVLYTANILLQTPVLTSFLPPVVSAALYIAVFAGMVIVVAVNLSIIYGCYMRICMPKDLEPKPEKPSRFAFVNEYRRRNEEKQIAEAEALRRKFEEKMQRKKKK